MIEIDKVILPKIILGDIAFEKMLSIRVLELLFILHWIRSYLCKREQIIATLKTPPFLVGVTYKLRF